MEFQFLRDLAGLSSKLAREICVALDEIVGV
jgi:hypothetical protein